MKKILNKALPRKAKKQRTVASPTPISKKGEKFQSEDLKKIATFVSTKYPSLKIYYQPEKICIDCPPTMRMVDKTAEIVLEFLACLRYVCGVPRLPVSINIETLRDISPMCALLMASEFHRWQLTKNMKIRLVNVEEWHPQIKRLFTEMGMFNLVIVENAYLLNSVESEEKYIKLRSAQLVKMGDALSNIDDEVAKIALVMNQNYKMYGGIEEAITNVTQWAYKHLLNVNRSIKNRWWFCASYNTTTKRTSIMVYDHGATIPKTLPQSGIIEDIRKYISGFDIMTWHDADIIEAAMTTPRSASGKQYRGKGLRWMKDLLALFDRGTLLILSGKGELRIDSQGRISKRRFSSPLGGTLIVWEVYGKEENASD